jgi:hypothetical protein
VKAATIQELKQELINIPAAELVNLCVRLAKYKKENKELLSYLLFEAHDEQEYVKTVKAEIDAQFNTLNLTNLYFTKKGLRKIVKLITKHIRYTASGEAEAVWLLYFCSRFKASGIPLHKNTQIANLYNAQVKKAGKVIDQMHEDLQYEYRKELERVL